MKGTIIAVFAGVVVAGKGLSPSWSFASTTTITDVDTPWYTISVPFLTTITTQVSGTVETITETKVSISIGTQSPSTIQPAASTTTPCNPISGAVAPECGDIDARFPPTSTEEFITYTHSNPQSNTINDSDVLPTTSPIGGYGSPVGSTLTTAAAGTTTEPGTMSATTQNPPLGYGGGDKTSSTSVDEVATVIVTITVGGATSTTLNSASISSSDTLTMSRTANSTTSAFVSTYVLSSSAVGPSTVPLGYGTAISTPKAPPTINSIGSTTLSNTASVISPTTNSTKSTDGGPSSISTPDPSSTANTSTYGEETTSSSGILTISIPTSEIPTTLITADPPTGTEEVTTFTTVKIISTFITTISPLPPPGSYTADAMTGVPLGYGDTSLSLPTGGYSTLRKVKKSAY